LCSTAFLNTLRKINNVIFDKTPPFFWLYGGDTEGATNSTLQGTVSHLKEFALAARPD
jgi:hypothetical protein